MSKQKPSYWTHKPTNLVYIVRLDNDVVTQAFGGIPEHEVTQENLTTWNFPNDPQDMAWINEHRSEFQTYEQSIQKVAEEEETR